MADLMSESNFEDVATDVEDKLVLPGVDPNGRVVAYEIQGRARSLACDLVRSGRRRITTRAIDAVIGAELYDGLEQANREVAAGSVEEIASNVGTMPGPKYLESSIETVRAAFEARGHVLPASFTDPVRLQAEATQKSEIARVEKQILARVVQRARNLVRARAGIRPRRGRPSRTQGTSTRGRSKRSSSSPSSRGSDPPPEPPRSPAPPRFEATRFRGTDADVERWLRGLALFLLREDLGGDA